MKEHPILFSGLMVRAILDGQKTQTRRIVTPQTSTINGPTCERWLWDELDFTAAWVDNSPFSPAGNPGPYLKVPMPKDDTVQRVYPRWFPGGRLWVRETWQHFCNTSSGGSLVIGHVKYRADDSVLIRGAWQKFTDAPTQKWWNTGRAPWASPIHMPRWASRITLEVTAVRVEPLQEIREADAIAEGMFNDRRILERIDPGGWTAGERFQRTWDDLNAKRGYPWKSNPWVWVVEFKQIMEVV